MPDSEKQELSRLTDYRRYTYAVASVMAMAIFFVSWLFRHPHDLFIAIGYPVFSVVYGVSCVMLIHGRVRLRLLEVGLVSLMAVIVLSRLAWHFIVGEPFGDNLMPLISGHYWAVGVLIVLAFIALGFKAGMAVAVVAFSFSALLATGASLSCAVGEPADCSNAMYFLRIHLFLLALLALTSSGTLLRDQTFAAIARAQVLEKLNVTDRLTSLANRYGAIRYLEKNTGNTSQQEQPLSVTLVNVDHFRRINHTHGRDTGDLVITRIGELLSEVMGLQGLVARWGSDEFLVIRPGDDQGEALHRAEHCRWRMEHTPIAGLAVTASFGVAQYDTEQGIDDVLCRADQGLAQARANGRNVVAAAPEQRPPPHSFRRREREDLPAV
ncbi:diguanylate cyclase domain-containing protein [Marinobacter lacisalsi]|uniref:diguanylate cyclase n=1 Tax=Marinobacter lacisalsi TaxID=475979 RepID=A0ABV8QIW4_9GAMM